MCTKVDVVASASVLSLSLLCTVMPHTCQIIDFGRNVQQSFQFQPVFVPDGTVLTPSLPYPKHVCPRDVDTIAEPLHLRTEWRIASRGQRLARKYLPSRP